MSVREQTPSGTSSSEPRSTTGGGVSTPSPVARKKPRTDRWRGRIEIAFLTVPALAIFVAFVMFPVASAAFYGFFRWRGFGVPTQFVGINNYVTILTDPTFLDALKHNAVIVVLSLVLQGPIAILFALLLNRKMPGQTLIRVLIFVPYVISEVVVGVGWSLILQDAGALNGFLTKVGLSQFALDWLADSNIAIWTLMGIITWKYIGFAVILFLAGLQGIPEELTEAAAIDGASFWKIQWNITLPLLGPTIRIWIFLSMIGALQLFDLVYIIWGSYVASTAGVSTMATYLVVNGRSAGNYGYGSAIAVVLFVISLVVALVYQRAVLRRDTEGALTGRGR